MLLGVATSMTLFANVVVEDGGKPACVFTLLLRRVRISASMRIEATSNVSALRAKLDRKWIHLIDLQR